jgi:peptide chain release factor subunit 1
MATTITWDDLRGLASFRAGDGCAVSVYMDLGAAAASTPSAFEQRTHALLDEVEKQAAGVRGDLAHDQSLALRSDVDRMRAYIEDELDRSGIAGLALFAASLDNLWRPLRLASRVPNAVRVNDELYVMPLVPLVGVGEGTVVAHVGRERGDVYLLRDGRLGEIADRSTEQLRRHDQGGWSQANYQRHVDSHVREHLRDVAQELDRVSRRLSPEAIVIASTDDVRAELSPMLSDPVQGVLAGWMRAASNASPTDLQERAAGLLADWHERREHALLERWRQGAGRGDRASAGWADTFEAASDGRVDVLLYREGVNEVAWRCPECGRIQAESGTCPLDGIELESHAEGLDLAVHHTLAHGGTALAVERHRDLEPVGGVGALLRY